MITKVWYSVQNGGDGSAYPRFMESEAMTRLDQDHMDEGWGECCNGYIEIEHDEPIQVKKVMTLDEMIANEKDRYRPNEELIEALKGLRDG